MADALEDFGSEELTEFFDYLDELREAGAVNMFGAGPYLRQAFGLTRGESHVVLSAWQKTFDEDLPATTRAFTALEA